MQIANCQRGQACSTVIRSRVVQPHARTAIPAASPLRNRRPDRQRRFCRRLSGPRSGAGPRRGDQADSPAVPERSAAAGAVLARGPAAGQARTPARDDDLRHRPLARLAGAGADAGDACSTPPAASRSTWDSCGRCSSARCRACRCCTKTARCTATSSRRTCSSISSGESSWAISAWPAAWPATRGATSRGRRVTWPPRWSRRSSDPSGPASDLYSLGFTAYELLCGTQQFELLFPGLEAFGRDRQVAWMMWHAAPDRRLPPVASVLGGVPDDLARVIDRLVHKDQTRRYPSAEHALADLSPSAEIAAKIGDPNAEQQAAEKAKARRRWVAIGALAASVASERAGAVHADRQQAAPCAGRQNRSAASCATCWPKSRR